MAKSVVIYLVRRIRTPQFCCRHEGAAKLIEIEAVSRRASEFQMRRRPSSSLTRAISG
jgi:hypothetical protein